MSNSVTNRLFKMVISYWPLLIVSTISAFIYVAFNGLSVWLTASLFNNILTDFEDLIINHDNLRNTKVTINDQLKYWTNELILRDTALESLKVLCYTIIGSFLFKNIFLYLKNIALTYIQFNLITKLRVRLYAHLLRMSLSYFDRSQSGELSSIVLNDVSNMRVAFGTSFHKLFVEPINIILFVALLLIINLKLALIAIIIVPLTGAIMIFIGRSIRRKSKRTAEKIARIMSIMAENLNSIRVVKSFSMESFETDRFTSEQERYYQLIFRRAKLRLISSPITEMIGAFIGVCLLWIGGHDVLVAQSMNSEDFIRFILILFSVLGPIRNLSNVSVELQKGFASADRVFEVLDTPVSIKSKPNATTISELNDQISFNNVSFNYDGTDIRDIDINSLRRMMGIVSQETILFNDTIKSNIKYGLQSVSDQRLEEAAKNANALDFIKEQPEGFETMIGEKGVRLSGGQRQRIAIARGILKNPPILILDEATSSLDTESEHLVQTAIDNLMAERTVLVIAHRLTTVENADSILVIDSGQVIASGTHQELLSQEGLYTRLYNKQFKK